MTRSTLTTEARIVGHGGLQEGDRAARLLVGHDLAEADARVVVDRDVDEVPAGVFVAATLSIASDSVAGTPEPTQLFDVDINQFARALALITTNRSLGLERTQSVEPQPFEDAADRGRG